MKPETIYRLFNKKGELLYIGHSHSVLNRIKSHHRDQPWSREVDWSKTKYESFGLKTKAEIEKIEMELIFSEKPKYNFFGNLKNENRVSVPVKEKTKIIASEQSEIRNGFSDYPFSDYPGPYEEVTRYYSLDEIRAALTPNDKGWSAAVCPPITGGEATIDDAIKALKRGMSIPLFFIGYKLYGSSEKSDERTIKLSFQERG